MIGAPDRRETVELIDQACASGTAREKACKEMGISLRSYQRWTRGSGVKADGRPTAVRPVPANKLTEAERGAILAVCNCEAYESLPPSQIVPRLADEGEYIASESSFYRVLRQEGQVQRRGRAQAPRNIPKPREYKATAPNQLWSWDITYLAASIVGVFFRLYLVMDIFSRKIVGWEIHESENAAHASVLIQKACLAEGISRKELVLHSDNGSPMKGATMLATLQKLGVVPSFSRPSVSDDNPYSESLFRTLKYTPVYPSKPFESIDAARQWVHRFVHWYNHEHRHSAIRFVTPAQRHRGEENAILAQRKAVYAQAKTRHPERWSGDIRNWDPVSEVWLNPEKPASTNTDLEKKAA